MRDKGREQNGFIYDVYNVILEDKLELATPNIRHAVPGQRAVRIVSTP